MSFVLFPIRSTQKPEPEDQVPTDEESWKVIKLWAEAMLPGAFGTINELASFITKNNLNSPASIASRQLLQKKLLQREIKERKKLTVSTLVLIDLYPFLCIKLPANSC